MNSSIANNMRSLDQPHAASASDVDGSLIDRIKRITSVSEVLRIFGACGVIASLLLFMFEGWSDGNDINRYFKLLGQTGLLTIAGLMLSFVMKEYKGARIFFGLGLVSAVTNFTILGALIYSIAPLDGLLGHYPEAVTWTVGSSSQFLMVCVGAIALLTLLAKFSYSIFAREISGPLTVSFLGLNALLLIPLRGSLTVSALTIVSLLVATSAVRLLRNRGNTALTPEAKFAFATLFLPSLIIVGRAIGLYHVDELFFLTLCGLVYYALRLLCSRAVDGDSEQRDKALPFLSIVQYCLGFVIAVLATQLLPNWFENFAAVSFSLIVFAFTTDQLLHSRSKRLGTVMLTTTAVVVVIMNLFFALATTMLEVQMASLAACVGMFVFANYAHHQVNNANPARLAALFGTVITSLIVALQLIAWINVSNWMSIGLIGMLLILIGSGYERFGLKMPSLKVIVKPGGASSEQHEKAGNDSLSH